jgi:hypothetical protein
VTVLLLLVVGVLAAADGFVVILKNGHKIRCREAMRIDGENAIITLVTGTMTSYPLSQVDLIETERYNKLGLGDALLIEELTVGGTPAPTPTPKRSLGHFASLDAGDATLGANITPTPTATPGIKLQNQPYHDPRVEQAFSKIFDDRNLYLYRTSAGTRPEYFYVQAVTDSQREVFEALQVVSEAYAILHQLHAESAPEAVELQMVQTSGRAAGTFRLTPELAAILVNRQISVEKFYVENVIF